MKIKQNVKILLLRYVNHQQIKKDRNSVDVMIYLLFTEIILKGISRQEKTAEKFSLVISTASSDVSTSESSRVRGRCGLHPSSTGQGVTVRLHMRGLS